MIIRTLIVLAEVVILFLMQTTVFPSIALAGVVPDLLLILVVNIGFMRGRTRALLTGLLCGFMLDCCYNNIIGVYALMYMSIGYLAGFSHRIYDENDYTIPLLITGIAEFLMNIMYFIVYFLLQGKLNIGFYLYRFTIPRILYTIVISILLYKFNNLLNVRLRRLEESRL